MIKKTSFLAAAISIMPIILCIACSTGTQRSFPEEAKSYSETVMVPGMSYEDLNMKLILFQARNGGFRYSAYAGKYLVSFDVSGNSPSEINASRNGVYYKAAELRKLVYRAPLDNEEDLWSEAVKHAVDGNVEAARLSYNIAVANPQFKPAVAMYAAYLMDLERYDDAIRLFSLVQEVESVPERIAEANALLEEQQRVRAAMQAAERERLAEEARQRMARWEEQKQENWDNLMNNLSNLANKNNQSYQGYQSGASSYAQPQAKSSGGGTGYRDSNSKKSNYNCGSAASRYNYAKSSAESISKRYYDDPEGRYSGGRVAKNDFKNAQAEMRRIREEASRNGCNSIHKSSLETKSL